MKQLLLGTALITVAEGKQAEVSHYPLNAPALLLTANSQARIGHLESACA